MRTMTAGMFHALHSSSRPGWQADHDLYKVAFKIVRSDSRIHLPMFGMRWSEEVARHAAIVENLQTSYDMAGLSRSTAGIYQGEDEVGQDG